MIPTHDPGGTLGLLWDQHAERESHLCRGSHRPRKHDGRRRSPAVVEREGVRYPMFLSMKACNCARGMAPTARSTILPFLNIMSVGIEVTPNFWATIGFSSTFILVISALPL